MDNDKNENEIDKQKLYIINEIFEKFTILFNKKKYEDIPIDFQRDKIICINEIAKCFNKIGRLEITFILFSFIFAKDKSVKNIINFLDTINTILYHFEYYKNKNPKIKYNNSHFDNYLLKRYECAYIFTNYLSERGCRELKIDNQLFFNYIPIKCNNKNHIDSTEKNKIDQKELEGCPYAHNKLEEIYHPFVYKKFKCFKNECKDDNCPLYHSDEEGNPIDMETEVDFDSNEMIDLQNVLSSLKLNKEDIKNNEKLEIFLQKKAKDTGDFIPTEFNPLTYKIYKCPLGQICKLDQKLCFNYHNNNDRRRNPNFHKAILCPNLFDKDNKKIINGKCKEGDNCDYAHNLYEYFYHPNKFRTIPYPREKKGKGKGKEKEKEKYCKERLICPYIHKTDSDCGKYGNKIVIDEKLVTDYYKSLMVSYEKSIKKQNKTLDEIENKYLCYICGKNKTSVLNIDTDEFLVDKNKNKIVCEKCANKNKIKTISIIW